MKKIFQIILLIPIIFNSCKYINQQVPSEKELLQKELRSINWNEVDEFPSIVYCDTIENKTQQQQCFFELMLKLIQEKLNTSPFSSLDTEIDTIEVRVTIFSDASLQFKPQFPNDSVAYDIQKIDSLFKARLVNFPKINPAIKRGVPVKTQFTLPVIIKNRLIKSASWSSSEH